MSGVLASLVLVPALVAVAAPASAATSATIYVATTGTDGPTCGASASPCLTVTQGMARVKASGADDMTVDIAAGTYTETVNVGTVAAGKTLTLHGAGASSTTIDANAAGSVVNLDDGSLTISRLTLTGGVVYSGGGISNVAGDLTVTDSTVSGNQAGNLGGGIVSGGSAELTVTDSTVSGNQAANIGGGIMAYGPVQVLRSTISDNTAVSHGGGVDAEAAATITDSTVSGNSSKSGGGVYSRASLTVTRSTVSGNTATAPGDNGGGVLSAGGTLVVADSTVSGNNGATSVVSAGGTSTITGSTLSNSIASDLLTHSGLGTLTLASSVLSSDGAACNGVVADGGANVTSDSSCGWDTSNGSKVSSVAAIGLQPLAANGSSGPKTKAIDASSSAHLVVPAADCTTTDERGESRPGGGSGAPFCDAGAFELQYTPLSAVYVAPSGDDTAGCGAESSPCKTVQFGVDQARFASVDDVTVHIAAGTYTETVDVGTWPAGKSLTLEGAGASSTTIDANQAGRVLNINGGTVTVTALTLTGGETSGDGGGVSSVGDLTLDRVEVVDNDALLGGGVAAGNRTLTITRSTLAGNTGGALVVAPGAVVSIATSTVSGNAGPGGAILNLGGDVMVSSSTLADNDGADAVAPIGGTTTIESSILSDSGCDSPVTDGGHNVTSDDSCGFDPSGGSVVGSVDEIALAPLGDFGGPTRTMPPSSFSLAAFPPDNRVPAGTAGCPTSGGSDQRGVARPKDDGCDVGAVELAPTSLQAALVGGKLTATATSATTVPANLPDPVGAVTFAQAYRTLSGCEQVPVDASGQMSCTPDSLVGTLYSTFESTNGYAYSRDTVAGVASITITPSSASVDTGDGKAYTVTGYDDQGASLGAVTSSASLTISPDGSCAGAVCTPGKAGVHTVTASLDGLSDNATLTATQAPVVTAQPGDQHVGQGDNPTFKAAASGYPTPGVQWQWSSDGKAWANIDGATSPTLVLADVAAGLNGTSYRAVFTNSAGTATSDPATLTVDAAATGSTSAGSALPRTGPAADPGLTAWLALALLAAGAALVAAARPRHRQA